jgi:hypothetical protein
VKSGWYQDGDPVLRHEYGSVLLAGTCQSLISNNHSKENLLEENFTLAEQQFVLGTDESARQLAAMLGPWCRSETGDQYSFGTVIMYATRTLLKLLVGRRPQQASVFLQAFSRQYSADLTVLDTAVKPESPHSDGEEHQIFQHPLMNFMHFLIATTVNRQNKDCYLAVSKRYGELLKRVYPESVKLLDDVGQIYFGIVPQQPGGQLNLNALLGAMFGGGNGGIPSG